MNPGEFRKQIAKFYNGIASNYDQIMGIHAEATEAEFQALLNKIEIKHFDRVFEIGCGPGVLSRRLLRFVDFCQAIDVAPEMVKLTRQNLADFDPCMWAVEEADILTLPAHLRMQKYDAVFFWGNGLTHIPPAQYADFAASVDEILNDNGLLIINLRDGREWIKFAGKLDLVSRFDRGANFVHIYQPQNPKVGDMFECAIVSVKCTGPYELSGQIVSPTIKAYFNDTEALLLSLLEKEINVIHDMPSAGLSTARTLVFQRRK